ncbi:MAG: hypothetical protein LBT60_04820 [Oscillospiraceae bacterium]|jgi:hypothetical protein|nr:hypothetical protein [Oscillospiraceae bacterium]
MASVNKTPALGLNQWEAQDAPLRVDFNADNQRVDAAYTGHATRLANLTAALEDTNYNVYQLYLQRYYESKPVPCRATMFFDGFDNTGMMDYAATTVQTVQIYAPSGDRIEYVLGGWDKRVASEPSLSAAHEAPTDDSYLGYGGSAANMRHSAVAQPFVLSEPFRLTRLNYTWKQYIQQNAQMEICAYAADGDNRPATLLQVLKTVPLVITQNITSERTVVHDLPDPVLLPAGRFALVFSCPEMAASQQGGRAEFYRQQRLGQSADAWINAGGWRLMAAQSYMLACNLFGGYVSDPPKYVSKEIALNRPCGTATVYLTQDLDSVGQIVPSVALYDSGETPVYTPMTRDPARDQTVSAARLETCWTLTLPAAKTRARVKLQFNGQTPDSRVYEYGCVLGG